MKEKVIAISSRFLVMSLAFLPMLPVLRYVEYRYLSHAPGLLEHALTTELTGLFFDFRAFVAFTLLLFIPFLIISLFHRKSGILFYAVMLGMLTLLHFSLIRYFAINLVPLDDVLFRYSFSEVRMIIRNSDDLDFMSFLPMILLILLFAGLQWGASRIKWQTGNSGLLLTCYLAALFLSLFRPPNAGDYDSDSAFYFEVNKPAFFLHESFVVLFREGAASDTSDIVAEITRYHDIHPEFDYTSRNFPLMHERSERDVLGPYFNLKETPPNLVFIIVESLSAATIGEDSWYGNFTPFLDSLKNESLYWDNFLSSSERTFHVFASLFGSLPYGNGEFQKDLGQIPFHYSLIRFLKDNGYFTGFYYGGDLNFTNYRDYFEKEETDYLMEDFGSAYEKKKELYPDFSWGYHDEFTFARSLEVIDSMNREPRLDIYLTLSTHHPFHPPNADHYLNRYEEITTHEGYPSEKKARTDPNRAIFSSMLYTDDALRDFFKAYEKRPEFNNTIFFITGDHFFMELGYSSISAIERYHVPFIIYSPLLKSPHHFSSVSSHQDVTPSVIELLLHKYDFREINFVHWLGKGIDTASNFRNTNTMQFVTSDKQVVDFLKGDYFLSKNRLYKIRPGLTTTYLNDNKIQNELKQDLKVTSEVYNYVNKTDRVAIHELFMPVKYDTVTFFTFDTTGLTFVAPTHLYRGLTPIVKFDTTYLKLLYDLGFQFMVKGQSDVSKVPRLIITIEDTAYTTLLYHQVVFPGIGLSEIVPGRWYPFHIKEILDVSSVATLKDTKMKIYFFNNKGCEILHDSVVFRLDGIY